MSAYNQGGENALLLRFRRLGQTGIMSEKENQIIVYQPNETVRLDVRLENETARGECCQCESVGAPSFSYQLPMRMTA